MTDNNQLNTQIRQAYEKAYKAYLGRDNVTAIDIGYKYVDGQRSDRLAVRIHVKEKILESALEGAEIFPKEIDGVPVDVIQAIYRPHVNSNDRLAQRKVRLNTIQPGISIGHPRVTAGTFGAVVYDNLTSNPCILSNWHVLAGSFEASPGDPILQPGPRDGGRQSRDQVARLERFLLNREGDAAIAVLDSASDRLIDPTQFETDVVIRSARLIGRLGEVLQKSSRTTGVTYGKVDGEGIYKIDYPVGLRTIEGFKLVCVTDGNPNDEEISRGGDSGSIWFDPETQEGVGLHFAGETDPNPNQEYALACHLPRVLTALNISLTLPNNNSIAEGTAEELKALKAVSLKYIVDNLLYIPFGDIATSPLTYNSKLCREIQDILFENNFYRFNLDGVFGGATREALRDFKEAYNLRNDDILGPVNAEILLRFRSQQSGIEAESLDLNTRQGTQKAIISECRKQGLLLTTQIAYVLATVEHETVDTFKPVKEAFYLGNKAEAYRKKLRYYPYYGRGYVQLTYRDNYMHYGRSLGIDLEKKPDLALNAGYALYILVDGMLKGSFTGRRLGQYINANRTNRIEARKVINGSDKAQHIANLAVNWESRIDLLAQIAPENAAETSIDVFDKLSEIPLDQLVLLC